MRQTIYTAYTAAAPYNSGSFLSLVFFVLALGKKMEYGLGETPVSQSLSAVGLSV